jgi:hypothetical protein
MIDLFCLALLWQAALGLALVFQGEGDGEPSVYVLAGSLLIGVTAVWYGAARRLTGLSVDETWRRAAVLCVALPVAAVASAGFLICAAIVCYESIQFQSPQRLRAILNAALMLAAFTTIGYGCRRTLQWAVRQRPSAD